MNRKNILNALIVAKKTYPQHWDAKVYNVAEKAIKSGKLLSEDSVVGLGTPFLDGNVVDVYLFKGKHKNQDLIIQIGKSKAETADIGVSVFRIEKEGKKWRVLRG